MTDSGMINENMLVAGAHAVALDANDYLIYNSSNKTLFYDADGNGAGQAVGVVTFANFVDLTYEHILIV